MPKFRTVSAPNSKIFADADDAMRAAPPPAMPPEREKERRDEEAPGLRLGPRAMSPVIVQAEASRLSVSHTRVWIKTFLG